MLLASHANQEGVRKRTVERTIQVGSISMRFVMLGLLAAVALLYLAQSTQSAARSYELRALEEKKSELTKESERLELEAVRLRSLQEIEKAIKEEPKPEGAEESPSPQAQAWEPAGAIHHLARAPQAPASLVGQP